MGRAVVAVRISHTLPSFSPCSVLTPYNIRFVITASVVVLLQEIHLSNLAECVDRGVIARTRSIGYSCNRLGKFIPAEQ